jgi:hypothetical protein
MPDASWLLLAYLGLGPEQDLIPYFLALLAWVGGSLIAILQWPFSALLRRLRKAKDDPTARSET